MDLPQVPLIILMSNTFPEPIKTVPLFLLAVLHHLSDPLPHVVPSARYPIIQFPHHLTHTISSYLESQSIISCVSTSLFVTSSTNHYIYASSWRKGFFKCSINRLWHPWALLNCKITSSVIEQVHSPDSGCEKGAARSSCRYDIPSVNLQMI